MLPNSKLDQVVFPQIFRPLFEKYRYKVFYGGRGGAKSQSIAQYLIISMLAEEHKTPVYGCFREVQESLKDSVKSLMMSVIEDLGVEDDFYTTETSKKIVCLRNGGCFVFAGLSNQRQVNKIKSMHNLIKAWVEEADGITEQTWDTFTPSIRGSDNSEIIVSFNPVRATDYIYDHFVRNTPPLRSLVVKVNYTDNPYFPEVLENERLSCLQYPEKYRRIWLGEPGHFEKQLLKPEWWTFYNNRTAMLGCLTGMFITADTAYKESSVCDYTAVQLWGYNGRRQLYLIDQIRGKWDFPTLIDRVEKFTFACHHLDRAVKPRRIYIEDKVSGISLVQTLKRKRMIAIPWKPKEFKFPPDKIGRVQESSLLISEGLVYLPKNAPWLNDFLDECGEFSEEGGGAYDDQVDAMTIAVSVWRSMGGGS